MNTYIARCPTCNLIIAGRVNNERHVDTARFLASCAKRGFPIESVAGGLRGQDWCKCERKERIDVPGLKLWKATVEVEVFVAAETQPSTWDFADAAREEIFNNHDNASVYDEDQVEAIDEVPQVWLEAIPQGYGNHDDLTCQQIVEANEAARLEAVRNSPMPNQIPLPLK